MKNLKVSPKLIALVTAGTIFALSGCSLTNTKTSDTNDDYSCTHLIVDHGNTTVVYKECEGYDFDYARGADGVSYDIKKDDKVIIDASASNYSVYRIDSEKQEEYFQPIEDEIVENGGFVYKLTQK